MIKQVGILVLLCVLLPGVLSFAPKAWEEDNTNTNFVRSFAGLPIDPKEARLATEMEIKDDRNFLAQIIRPPIDIGDPIHQCTPAQVAQDLRNLKRLQYRIRHRRVALAQHDQWLNDAKEKADRIQLELRRAKETANTLSTQVSVLEQEKDNLLNHVRETQLSDELAAAEHHQLSIKIKNARNRAGHFSKLLDHRSKAQKADTLIKSLEETQLKDDVVRAEGIKNRREHVAKNGRPHPAANPFPEVPYSSGQAADDSSSA